MMNAVHVVITCFMKHKAFYFNFLIIQNIFGSYTLLCETDIMQLNYYSRRKIPLSTNNIALLGITS